MLTEDEARTLLRRAADTIDMSPAPPIELPPRRPWLAPVVAAAAVLAAVVVGLVVVHDDGARTTDPVDVPTPVPVVPEPNGRIPSVFAYDADSATKLLESLGLTVRRQTEASCNTPGRALRTEPRLGATYQRGDRVTLVVSAADPTAACKMPDLLAWRILDFANGRGPDPGFADDVRFRLNGADSTPEDALAALAALTRRVRTVNLEPHDSFLQFSGLRAPCTSATFPVPTSLGGRTPYAFDIVVTTHGLRYACPSVQVLTDQDGRIDALLVINALHEDPVARALADRLLGFARGESARFPGDRTVRFYTDGQFWSSLTGTQAEDRGSYSLCSGLGPDQCPATYLDALAHGTEAYAVTTVAPPCFPAQRLVGEGRGGGSATAFVVSANAGTCAGAWAIQLRYDSPDDLVAVNVMSTVPDPERDLRDVADRFIDVARGKKDSLPVDTPVKLYLNERLVRTVTARAAQLEASYPRCPLDIDECRGTPFDLIRSVDEVPALRRAPRVPACLDALPPALTADDTGGARSITITHVDDPCAWAVQLWVNEVGQVVAVDLRTHKQA